MSQFSLARLRRLLLNDVLHMAKPMGFGTVAALFVSVLLYLYEVYERGPGTIQYMRLTLFALALGSSGLLFTSLVFRDLHHPLERYRYLLLPCTNLERLASRYLLTGPLFLLYSVAAFMVIDLMGIAVAHAWCTSHGWSPDAIALLALKPFSPIAAQALWIPAGYLLVHVLMFTGAIVFRSYSLIRTVLAVSVLLASMAALAFVTLRAFNPDSFDGWKGVGKSPLLFMPVFEAWWMNAIALAGFALWLLIIAYRCLREHEVQDGL